MNRISKESFSVTSVFFALLAATCGIAQADNLKPAPWQDLINPHPFSTYSEWVFDSPANPRDADIAVNKGDGHPAQPFAQMGAGPVSMVWDQAFGGIWFPDPTVPPTPDPADWAGIQLFIPNWIDEEPIKRIRTQITFHAAPTSDPSGGVRPFAMPVILGISGMDGSLLVGGFPVGVPELEFIDPLDAIWHMYHDWEMWPNPDWEYIWIAVPPDTGVLQIVVDTISIPEPSALLLLAVGLFALPVRRR